METAETIREFELLLTQVSDSARKHAYKFAHGIQGQTGSIHRANRFMRMCLNTNQSRLHRAAQAYNQSIEKDYQSIIKTAENAVDHVLTQTAYSVAERKEVYRRLID